MYKRTRVEVLARELCYVYMYNSNGINVSEYIEIYWRDWKKRAKDLLITLDKHK